MTDGLTLKIENDFLAISALLDQAHGDTERIRQQYEALRTVIGKHFGQVVAMHDTNSLPERLDQEIAYLKQRAGVIETPENRCGACWTLRWNDPNPCRNCSGWPAAPSSPSAGWRPMGPEARKPGRVLVYCSSDDPTRRTVFEAWWRTPYEGAPPEQCWWCYDGDKTMLSADIHKTPDGRPLGATMWMPLPLPPESK